MASSVALSSSMITTPNTIASSTAVSQPRTFLNRCVEELDPQKISDLEWDAAKWNAIALVTVVAFTALAVGAFVATGVLASAYLPVAGIGSLMLADKLVLPYCRQFQENSAHSANRANQLKEINVHYEPLKTLDTRGVEDLLFRDFNINPLSIRGMAANPENIHSLKPLIARCKFWQGQMQKYEQQKQDLAQQAQTLIDENQPENRVKIYHLQTQALETERAFLESKVKTAFVLAALRRSEQIGELESIGDFSTISHQERVLRNHVGNQAIRENANRFFIFRDSSHAPLTAGEISQSQLDAICLRLFDAAVI